MEQSGERSTPASSSLSCSPSSFTSSLFGFEDDKASSGRQETKPEARGNHTPQPVVTTAEGTANTYGHQKSEDFSPERYLLWHKRVLLHRARVGPGRSHEMCRLYNFWLSFLPDKFNDAMYQALKRYAEEDASAGHTFGLSCLFHFYLRYLSQDFEPEVYQDFETLALKYQDYLDYEEGMDCLCQFLAGASAAQGPHQPGRGDTLTTTTTSRPPSTSTTDSTATALPSSTCYLAKPRIDSAPDGTACLVSGPSSFTNAACALSASGSAASSVSSGMLLLSPGLPRVAGVEVDPRVLEQLHAWQAARSASTSLYAQTDECTMMHSDAPASESLAGSSEAGVEGENGTVAAAHTLQPKRLGRRPNGKLVQAMRRASARCPSPSRPATTSPGASPPSAHAAECAASAPGRCTINKAGSNSIASASAACLPPGARSKRARQPKANKRGAAAMPQGASPTDVAGTTPPPRLPGNMPQSAGNARASRRAAGAANQGSSNTAFSAPLPGGARTKAKGRAQPGSGASGQDGGEVPLWEAQPCDATYGAAAAELAKALPLRLGELFGD